MSADSHLNHIMVNGYITTGYIYKLELAFISLCQKIETFLKST